MSTGRCRVYGRRIENGNVSFGHPLHSAQESAVSPYAHGHICRKVLTRTHCDRIRRPAAAVARSLQRYGYEVVGGIDPADVADGRTDELLIFPYQIFRFQVYATTPPHACAIRPYGRRPHRRDLGYLADLSIDEALAEPEVSSFKVEERSLLKVECGCNDAGSADTNRSAMMS